MAKRRLHAVIVASWMMAGLGPAVTDTPIQPVSASVPFPATAGQGQAPQQKTGHEGGEGLKLAAREPSEPSTPGPACRARVPARSYQVVAIGIDITLNRYLDHDPQGRMYVLEDDLAAVVAEQAQNAAARRDREEPAVSIGLQGDAIQPLTLRVAQGECLRIQLRNGLAAGEGASIHVHGAALLVAGTGTPAIATNPRAMAGSGESVQYEWMVDASEPEGTHYFHSHGDQRAQSEHGLFGAVIVEPAGSTWLDPRAGRPLRTGWDAVIRAPGLPPFREYVLYYHEVGDESYAVLDKNEAFVPLVDPITSAYRPNGRALNYRSEPFMNRLRLQQQMTGSVDESLEYSSYAFGDPATPILRGYLGDPVKQRVVHGGSEVFHVHHVHGGSTRWSRQAGAEPLRFDKGLDKRPPVRPSQSDRTDSQSLGPSEVFDVIAECGSGGCQQSVGDFMFHCHVTHHYFAGMWGIWRVYNTLQDGRASTDSLLALLALPDRTSRVDPAVTSAALVGRTVDSYGVRSTIDDLASWVERQLPPKGTPKGYDASVFDWSREGDVYLGEPETEAVWPGYRARAPGQRPPLLFDPRTGKLAYPFLRPHLGKRPPFAPGHGPAPFLDPIRPTTDPAPPGANGPASICPEGTRPRLFALNAVSVPIPLNAKQNIVDPAGQLFVLRQEEEAVRSYPRRRVPLAIRANAGEDCVDVLLRSELADQPDDPFSKVSAHIHFTQFDVQASDGVNTGFNYEQTVRPFRIAGETIASTAAAGETRLRLQSTDRFQPGAVIGVGMDRDKEFESRRIVAVDGDIVVLDAPLVHGHAPGEYVSSEFVRYRWYPDVQAGSAFLHDHVNVVDSGRHGLFGVLVVEPPRSTYHDPRTGEEIISGIIADIHTDAVISADAAGSFRELVVFIQDDVPLNQVGRSTGSAFGMRAEPPEKRGRDPALMFSSEQFGDPETPVLEAVVGDPIVVRTLVAASNEVHSWHLDGHWFRREPYTRSSPPTNTIAAGISERFDLVIPRAGGPQAMPGDYLYYSGRTFKLREGSWGLVRAHTSASEGGLRPLPGRDQAPVAASHVCPTGAPRVVFCGSSRRGAPSHARRVQWPAVRAAVGQGGGPVRSS